MKSMNRRDFLATLAATAATPLSGLAQPATSVQLEIAAASTGPTIPLDFTGLSYETAQLANPAFFSAANKTLINLFRGLSPEGVRVAFLHFHSVEQRRNLLSTCHYSSGAPSIAVSS